MVVRAPDAGSLNGPLIGGRYSLGEPLGSGGAALVRWGWDMSAWRPVALKSPHKEGLNGGATGHKMGAPLGSQGIQISPAELRWRIEREGRIMAMLTYSHVAQFYDYFESEGRPWLVMEMVEGMDLGRAVKERGPLPMQVALNVGRQMCVALGAIHAAGVIHRDVKPRNIILSSSGHAKLIDFDLAWSSALEDDGDPSMVYGTPEYMAPEQAMGERIAPATDLYGLGVTLYELLAGRAPFHDGPASVIMWRHVAETPPKLREWRHDLPAPIERVVMRALAKDPRRRYPNAEAMGLALAQAEEAARLSDAHYGWRPLPAAEARPLSSSESAPETRPRPAAEARPPVAPAQLEKLALVEPVAPVARLASAPFMPIRIDSGASRWFTLVFWSLVIIGLTLALIFFITLAQRLPG